ncbi:MAG: hypothetical protein OEZ36_03105 [Spirochaetota bacterium]|nr:hypothetical protein [Spirochaetota bacterium]
MNIKWSGALLLGLCLWALDGVGLRAADTDYIARYYQSKIQRENLGIILGYPFLDQTVKPKKMGMYQGGGSVTSQFIYKSSGFIMRVTTEKVSPADESISETENFLYNKHGQLISSNLQAITKGQARTVVESSVSTYEHNVKKQIIKTYSTYSRGESDKNTSETSNVKSSINYYYDRSGRLVSKKVQTTQLNIGQTPARIQKKSHSWLEKYKYDNNGNIKSRNSEWSGDFSYEYNPAGQLLKIKNAAGYTDKYSY